MALQTPRRRKVRRKTPKIISPSDPLSAWTAKANKRVQFGYGLNYLIDVEHAVIVDVEATPARTYDEVAATQTMIDRTIERFDLKPKRLMADTAYGTGKFLGWLVKEKQIAPYIPVWDNSQREDGTFSRDDFAFDQKRNLYVCPAGKTLTTTGRVNKQDTYRYIASLTDCRMCHLKQSCCPKGKNRHIKRRVVMVVPHVLAAPLIVANTDLVALVFERIARRFAAEHNLSIFEPPIVLPEFTIDLLTSAARANDPALRWLLDQISKAAGE